MFVRRSKYDALMEIYEAKRKDYDHLLDKLNEIEFKYFSIKDETKRLSNEIGALKADRDILIKQLGEKEAKDYT